MTGPDKPSDEENAGAEDTLPATSGLGVPAGASDMGVAEMVATPRSRGSGRGAAPVDDADDEPSDVGHAQTVSGHSPVQSPGGGADQVRVAVGTLLGKRYRIGEHLGSGGMGTVYAAHDLLVDQAVALKFVRPSLASDHRERERLRHEVRLAQSVTHVNVARTYTLDEIDNQMFIVMELLRGPTLSARLRNGALALDEAIRIARDLLHGLAAAHGRGILHRDIKPGNVKLVDDGRAVIMDFGMARASENSTPPTPVALEYEKLKVQITHTMLGGTPGYIAPEILRGRRGDARADLYSFGVMLFEMLTGRAPFASTTPQELLVKHLEEQPTSIDSLRPEVPPHIAVLVGRLLAKDPDQRPHSADAVRRDLLGPDARQRASESISIVPGPRGSGSVDVVTPRTSGRQDTVTTDRGLPVVSASSLSARRAWLVVAGVVIGGGVTLALAMASGRSGGRGAGPIVPVSEPSVVAPGPAPTPAPTPVPVPVVAAPVVDAGVAPAHGAPEPQVGPPVEPPGSGGLLPSAPGKAKSLRTPPPRKWRKRPRPTAAPGDTPADTTRPDDPKNDAAEKRRRQLELED